MVRYTCRSAAVALLVTALPACSGDGPRASPEGSGATASESPNAAGDENSNPQPAEPSYLPAGDLPDPLSLEDVGARTVVATPFADFAVAASDGVWVSGVDPGAVRYDSRSGRTSARVRVIGEVGQALGAGPRDVLIPVTSPDVLLRVSAVTGMVRSRVKLPASPQPEAAVGVRGDTGYILVDPADPRIVVVEGDRVTDEIPAPEYATAVRAGFGSLWVSTINNTVERYSFESKQWTRIEVGPKPRFLDVGFNAVWVMNQGDGSITRIDAESGTTEALPVTGEPINGGDLTVGADAVWLRTDSQVARIDPRTRAVTHVIDLPPGSGSAAATDDVLVITNHDYDAVHLVPLPLSR